ncbi:DNA topoisomerase [Sutcliffiella sp. NPDC057660]|uniref:type IA DNA topoisomerase n=1 Tax=Sutcliffiella sp. NPDC057660 TaxID=3346199 RepID=UPI00368EEEDD
MFTIKLIIFEKPSQARTVCKIFKTTDRKLYLEIAPNEYMPKGGIAVWCVGHVLRLAEPSKYSASYKEWKLEHLPIIPENLKLEVDPSKYKIYKNIVTWIQKPEIKTIIHAGDPAREGTLLVSEVIKHSNTKKPVQRFWSASLTKDAVHRAFKNLKDMKFYQNSLIEGELRQASDWIIGMNASRTISILMHERLKAAGHSADTSFSLGRVQTSLLSIVYRREMEIESFKMQPFWNLEGTFMVGEETYTGRWFLQNQENIFDQEKAQALLAYCKNKTIRILSVDKEQLDVPPPQFYNLTALQEDANKKFHYSPDEVLELAQALYIKGAISYPRADPRVVSEDEAREFPRILSSLTNIPAFKHLLPAPIEDISKNKRFIDITKVDDHYAIIPTEDIPAIETLSEGESRIYKLIVNRFIGAHYPSATYDQMTVITIVDEQFSFKTRGKTLTHNGWRDVVHGEQSNAESDPGIELETMPSIKPGDEVLLRDLELREGITSPPPRYSQGQLVKVMEQAGRTLNKEEKAGFSNKELSIGTVATRAAIINQIINKSYIKVEKNLIVLLPKGRTLIKAIGENNWLASPLTTGNMERTLKEIGEGKRKPGPFTNRVKELVTSFVSDMRERSETWVIDTKDLASKVSNKRELGPCRFCGEPVVDKGSFYGCTAYQTTNCEFSLPKKMLSKELTQQNIINLLEKGNAGMITNFKKKNADDYFDAFLVWNDNKRRLEFSFEGIKPKKKS